MKLLQRMASKTIVVLISSSLVIILTSCVGGSSVIKQSTEDSCETKTPINAYDLKGISRIDSNVIAKGKARVSISIANTDGTSASTVKVYGLEVAKMPKCSFLTFDMDVQNEKKASNEGSNFNFNENHTAVFVDSKNRGKSYKSYFDAKSTLLSATLGPHTISIITSSFDGVIKPAVKPDTKVQRYAEVTIKRDFAKPFNNLIIYANNKEIGSLVAGESSTFKLRPGSTQFQKLRRQFGVDVGTKTRLSDFDLNAGSKYYFEIDTLGGIGLISIDGLSLAEYQNKKYQKAIQENTIAGYENYLYNGPASRYVSDIKQRLSLLEFDLIKDTSDIKVLDTFATKYPEFTYLQDLNDRRIKLSILGFQNRSDETGLVNYLLNNSYAMRFMNDDVIKEKVAIEETKLIGPSSYNIADITHDITRGLNDETIVSKFVNSSFKYRSAFTPKQKKHLVSFGFSEYLINSVQLHTEKVILKDEMESRIAEAEMEREEAIEREQEARRKAIARREAAERNQANQQMWQGLSRAIDTAKNQALNTLNNSYNAIPESRGFSTGAAGENYSTNINRESQRDIDSIRNEYRAKMERLNAKKATADSNQASKKMLTRYYSSTSRQAKVSNAKLIGDYSYEICYTGGMAKGKCSPRTGFIFSYPVEAYLAAVSENTCRGGTQCDSFGRLVEARKSFIEDSNQNDDIKNFRSQRY